MGRRDDWRKILDAEVARWSALPYMQLVSELRNHSATYEIEAESKTYQVEVELLQDNETQLLISVAVDDGSLPASILPATKTFISNKPAPTA